MYVFFRSCLNSARNIPYPQSQNLFVVFVWFYILENTLACEQTEKNETIKCLS